MSSTITRSKKGFPLVLREKVGDSVHYWHDLPVENPARGIEPLPMFRRSFFGKSFTVREAMAGGAAIF